MQGLDEMRAFGEKAFALAHRLVVPDVRAS